jgi:hypothetical protein
MRNPLIRNRRSERSRKLHCLRLQIDTKGYPQTVIHKAYTTGASRDRGPDREPNRCTLRLIGSAVIPSDPSDRNLESSSLS